MDNFTIRIFDKTPQTVFLRLLSGSGEPLDQCELVRAEVDAWIDQVEKDYWAFLLSTTTLSDATFLDRITG